jgi:HD-GYP domain-containing protein (c-di-GMP phosphodiesterase class II)
MLVGRAVYSSSGQLLVNRGVSLTKGIIKRLVSFGIPSLYIDDGFAKDLPLEDIISEQTRLRAIQQVKGLLVVQGKDSDHPVSRAIVKVQAVAQSVNKMIEELLEKKTLIVNLADIRALDDYTFGHSVNVCVLSLLTGITLSYTRSQLFHLGMGAILHDLGKVKVPKAILQKPGPLTEEEFTVIRQHPEWGHAMAQALAEVTSPAATILLQHHERYDGTGYPYGLKGIHHYATICGIADVFDALTADRVYRKAVPVHEAYESIAGSGNYLFDYSFVRAFLENVAAYPSGTLVRLSTGEVAIVVETPRGAALYPVVRVLFDQKGRPIEPYQIHLAEQQDVVISKVVLDEDFLLLSQDKSATMS